MVGKLILAAILDTLLSSVLPVALIFVMGYLAGRRGGFSQPDTASILKFIAHISAPAIIVNIVITTDVASLDPTLASLYLISELMVYAIGFFITWFWFRLGFKDALLCGLAASFANHVLFVYPITQFAFDPVMSIPVRSIITIDIIIFTLTIIILDIHQAPSAGPLRAMAGQLRNPLLLALLLGVLIVLNPFGTPLALIRCSSFTADAAAPCGLFASGILLARPISKNSLKLALVITGLKMLLHPILGVLIIILAGSYAIEAARTTLMVTAAPVGVMALTFASRYEGKTDAIAQSIFWSFCLSGILVPIFAVI